MNRYQNILKGGALVGALLITPTAILAYNQEFTHPALTDEIVDFYNLNFSGKKLNNEEKQWLVQGSIDEDNNARSFFHFYDPIYDRGIQSVYTAGLQTMSSKKWALADNVQRDFYNSQQTGFAAFSNAPSVGDFSYHRALDDYVKGDKKRAFMAFGHVLHLLEDAGVPEHTRNDTHPPFIHGEESPYESEMAKWKPGNLQIARELFLKREKPVTFYTMESYFDRVANYSNSNFFSKDTIFSKEYPGPSVERWEYKLGFPEILIGYKTDKFGEYGLVIQEILRDKNKPPKIFIDNANILDGYWKHLSKEVVLNGAGALRLFLEEAEKAKEEYARKPPEKPSFLSLLLGALGIGDTTHNVDADLGGVDNDLQVQVRQLAEVTQSDNDGVTNATPRVSPKVSLTPTVSPKLSPSMTPKIPLSPSVSPAPTPTPKLSTTEKININTANKELLMTLKGIKDAKSDAIIQYRQTYGSFQKIEDIMNVSGIGQATFEEIKGLITVGDIVPTPSPVFSSSGGGGGGGGGGGSSSTPTPTPSPSVTPTPTSTPTPEPDGNIANQGDVVINEIAWMGTASSANNEWIELRNTTSQTIGLTGWILEAQDGTPTITLSGSISASGFFLLERTDDETLPTIAANQIYTGALGNTGEFLVLKNVSGSVIDQIDATSGWPAGDNTTKETAQKMDSGWVTATPTPKSENQANIAQNPSAVTDLLATLNSPLTVTWSAPDPGSFTPASLSYDLRYSLDDFSDDEGIWDIATKVASSSLPSVGEKGASQGASFDIAYEYGQTLYFALKTGLSDISNIAEINFPTAIDANAWAMLGKNQYHTSFAANIAGPTDPMATISWEFDAGSAVPVSQPVADAEGNIYFGASDGTMENSKIYSIRKDGENIVENWAYGTNVSVGTSAVLSDGTVYFGRVGAGGILAFTALNSDGTNKWDYTAASSVNSVTVSSDGKPHFAFLTGSGSQMKLVSLNTGGSLQATIATASGIFSPIILDDGASIITRRESGNQFFSSYSASGAQLWANELVYADANGSIQSNPSYDQTTGKTYSAVGYDGGSIYASVFVIPADGSAINRTVISPANLGSGATMVAITPTKLLVGFDYTWSNSASGSKLFALNKSDLTTAWSFQAEGKINQQVAVDKNNNAYFSTEAGTIYSVDASGNQNWSVETGIFTAISPVLTENGVIWGYGSKIVGISP